MKRTNDTNENQDAVKIVQTFLLQFFGRGPHIPYGVKSTGLSLLAKMQNQLEGNMEPEARESTAQTKRGKRANFVSYKAF